jgi:hypothetical protein
MGIAGMRKKKGGIGRAKPDQHPGIFPSITGVPNEPKSLIWGRVRDRITQTYSMKADKYV